MRRPSPSIAVSLAALVIALGSTGWAANGGNFLLGLVNSATQRTYLGANYNGTALQVSNTSAGASATALTLSVAAGHPALKVNTAAKVTNLNADWLDGFSSASFVHAAIGGWHYVGDPGEPAFEHGWVNVDPAVSHLAATHQHAAFRIDNNNVVHLAGVVKGGTGAQSMFTLPAAYCPMFTKSFPVNADGAFARILAGNGPGSCTAKLFNGSLNNVTLNGVSFPTAASDALVAAGP